MIRDAVAHHDQQEYDEAATLLSRVLELEPDNGLAAYELALTYQVAGELQLCIASATTFLERTPDESTPPYLASELYSVLASCHSAAGESAKALQVFRSALALDPDDYGLNFNIAITLTNAGRVNEAIEHLGLAIMADPLQPSPYYVIAVLYQQQHQNIPAILAFMSFLQREFNTERCNTAARGIFDVAYSNVTVDESGDGTTIFADPLDKSTISDVAMISLGLSIAVAASAPGGEVQEPIFESLAGLIQSFISISAAAATKKKSGPVTSDFLMPNVTGLKAAGVSTAFSYLVVSTAGVDGAKDWLDSHPDEVDALVEHLKRTGEKK